MAQEVWTELCCWSRVTGTSGRSLCQERRVGTRGLWPVGRGSWRRRAIGGNNPSDPAADTNIAEGPGDTRDPRSGLFMLN